MEKNLDVTAISYLVKLTFRGIYLEVSLAKHTRVSTYWSRSAFSVSFIALNHATHSPFLSMLCTKLAVSQPLDAFYMLMPLYIPVCLEEPTQI